MMLASYLFKQELSCTSCTMTKHHENTVGVKEFEVLCDTPTYTMIRTPMFPGTLTSPSDLPSLTSVASYR